MLMSELYGAVFDYLEHRLTLNELERWLLPRLDAILSNASPDGQELVNVLELNRAEVAAGHRSEDELREEVRAYIDAHPTVDATFREIVTSSASSVQIVNVDAPESGVTMFSYRQL